jgi:hypothetical protein
MAIPMLPESSSAERGLIHETWTASGISAAFRAALPLRQPRPGRGNGRRGTDRG